MYIFKKLNTNRCSGTPVSNERKRLFLEIVNEYINAIKSGEISEHVNIKDFIHMKNRHLLIANVGD